MLGGARWPSNQGTECSSNECPLESRRDIHTSGIMEQESAILALAALAQNTRLDTFRLLVKNEPGGLPAGELARAAGIPQNTMSAHLAVLSRAGLIIGERRSRSIVYRANLRTFEELTRFMVQDCCGGSSQLNFPALEHLQACRPSNKKTRSRKDGNVVVDCA
jgi:ArsR family transcriptional regulator